MTSTAPTPLKTLLAVALMIALGACGDTQGVRHAGNGAASYPGSPQSRLDHAQSGVVQSIELVQLENSGSGGSGGGAVVGAVVGGILGNQIVRGSGNTAATVIGAAGGAYAGSQIGKQHAQTSDAYRITVLLTDGSYQTVTQPGSGDLRVGDRVHVANGVAQRY